jgi:hypothetical protein
MTDTSEGKTSTPQFKTGDTISIMRGIHRNDTATVLDVDEANEQYAVRLTSGGVAVVNFVNAKGPEIEPIDADKLAGALNSYGLDATVLGHLESVFPQLSGKLSYPA